MSDLLTVAEAAKFIGVTDKAVYLAIEKRRIVPIRLLGKLGIPKEEAERYKEKREAGEGNGGSDSSKKKAA